jgi:hypothetical protein
VYQTLLELEGAGGGRGAGGRKRDQVVMDVINTTMERLPAQFDMIDIPSRIPERTPYLVVMLQECDRMNILLAEISRSLSELKLGLQGALNISEAMELLTNALFIDRVPGTWTVLAYPSLKGYASLSLSPSHTEALTVGQAWSVVPEPAAARRAAQTLEHHAADAACRLAQRALQPDGLPDRRHAGHGTHRRLPARQRASLSLSCCCVCSWCSDLCVPCRCASRPTSTARPLPRSPHSRMTARS